jgi:hypothetical protein
MPMGASDQKQFTDSVAGLVPGTRNQGWAPAVHALNRLAMFDMLPALAAVPAQTRELVERAAVSIVGPGAAMRMRFARQVIQLREIPDFSGLGVPPEQVNDGREFLGCTRLDDSGVQRLINEALSSARAAAPTKPGFAEEKFAGEIRYAWLKILVPRRQSPGGSLISDLAAAAHYMLARYHTCAAKATVWQMSTIVDGYDAKKRHKIASGDVNLSSMAIVKGNRPFPPDFAIKRWAKKGAEDGERDRLKHNPKKTPPLVAPTVNQSEWGE